MKEIFEVWRRPRMLISILLCALFYAAALIPFEFGNAFLGISGFRPAAFMPIMSSFILGPGAAWGSALGTLIADGFGNLSNMTIFSVIGNFLLGYMPYKFWSAFLNKNPLKKSIDEKRSKDLLDVCWAGLASNLIFSVILAIGIYWSAPDELIRLSVIIFMNNLLAMILLIPALRWIMPLARKYELVWEPKQSSAEGSNRR